MLKYNQQVIRLQQYIITGEAHGTAISLPLA